MINSIRTSIFKNGYLIITAAWLYTFSIVSSNYFSYNLSPQKVQTKLEHQINKKEERFNTIVSDTTLLSLLIKDTANSLQKNKLTNESFGLFIYTNINSSKPILSYWNSNHYYTDPEDIQRKDGNYFLKHQNGSFQLIKKTIKLSNDTLFVVALLPVKWDYFIENKYLISDFESYPGLDEQYVISSDSKAFHVHSINGDDLFKIKLKEGKNLKDYDIFTIFLRTAAIVFLFFFFNAIATDLSDKNQFKQGFLLLLSITFLLRFFTYQLPIPFDFNRINLFDPAIYASNFLHPSLGDLLINALLLFWLISFYKFNHKPKHPKNITKKDEIFAYLNLVLLSIIYLIIVAIIRSLILDSKVSFDVTNVLSLNYFSIISFIILGLLMLIFYNFSHILLEAVFRCKIKLPQQILTVVITILIFLSFNIGAASAIPNFMVLAWLMLYIFILHFRKKDILISIFQSSFFIFWVMFFATSIASIVIYENKIVELDQRKKIAEQLTLQEDPLGESLLTIAATNFNDKFLTTNFNRFKTEYSNKFIKDSLIDQNFSGYLNKYDTRIYTYDSLFHPMFNDDSTKYATIKTLILTQAKKSAVPGLFIYNNVGGTSGYIYEKEIKYDSSQAYLFVVVKPKKYISEALFPELFKQTQEKAIDLNTDYVYAIYSNGKMIRKFNDYNFPIQVNKNNLLIAQFEQKNNGAYNELWYHAFNGKQIFIAKRNNFYIEYVTLFAYLFCIFLLMIFLFRVVNYFLQTRFKSTAIKHLLQFNIRSQIHATIILVSIFSFLVIGIATISFFIIRFNKNNQERLLKSLQVITSEVENKFRSQVVTQKALTVNDIGLNNDIEKAIAEISETHNVDVNFFDVAGTLKVSTQPYIYNKHLLSDKMEPIAYDELHRNNKTRLVQQEKIGNLSYVSIYAPITDEDGNTYAYLNIPYLNAQAELDQEISGFLAALINLNAFIFLITGAIAFLITNKITSTFNLIGDKMKQINFNKVNEEIEWKRKDEIGILVNEYNKMVKKLNESAKALAQSEREGAWREMARQVAHEIKNPLTPMKLSIQYLQKAINSDAINAKELSQNVAKTLVEQIDQLAQIAGDFSQFANIGNVSLQEFDLGELLTSLINLYQTDVHVTLQFLKEEGNYKMKADKVQINRLFTNLLKNAIEATEEINQPIIIVEQKIINQGICISIKDNGKGISSEVQQKIFMPNFTTKSSGTGLGLAICKGIVEKANGQIWFETQEAIGTTFFIEFPSK